MQLLLIVAVLAALIVAEHAPDAPVETPVRALTLALACMAVVPLYAAWISRKAAAELRRGTPRPTVVRRLRRWRAVHAMLWLIALGAVLLPLGWPRLVRYNAGLDGLFLIDELAILMPVLLPLIASWAAFYTADRVLHGGVENADRRADSRRAYVALHVRHYLAILLIPVLVLLAVQDAAAIFFPDVDEQLHLLFFYLPAVAAIALAFPSLLRRVWETQPLAAGPLRDRLEETARLAGFHAREILVWKTGGRVLNAAVTGFLPALRYVFLTDGLLDRMNEEQVHAVFGHEIGHLRHRHLWFRVAAMLMPLSAWFVLGRLCPGLFDAVVLRLRHIPFGQEGAAALIGLFALSGYMLFVFGPYCRLLEGQADLFGCQALAVSRGAVQPVETFIAALETLATAGAVDRNAAGWQHASIARRVEFLRQIAADPDAAYRFERRVAVISGLVLAALLSPLFLQLLGFSL